ncbi:MAG: hypothetical protein QOI11_1628 [Candidatus Eremiobacteraeota bacterium]|nr:hypothetical protein [Candidatus Eremiobacteraeota bacterium]
MGKDSSEIRREIEETRARMGDTVEALSYKADVPNRVKDAVNDKVETVKGTISDVVGNVKDAVSGASGKVGSALGGAKEKAGTTWSDTTDKVGDTVGGVTDKLGGVTDKLGSVTGKLPSPGDVTGAAKRGVGIALENPLGLAIGAAAVGFLAGLLIPVTDYERETIGPIRDDLVDKAQHMGSDVLEHGKAVLQETAQAAFSTAQQSAQTHGQQVVQNVQDQNGGDQSGDSALSSAGMPSNASQGGGLRDETLMSGGTGSQTPADTGKTSSEYGVLLDDDLKPGSPGTASP